MVYRGTGAFIFAVSGFRSDIVGMYIQYSTVYKRIVGVGGLFVSGDAVGVLSFEMGVREGADCGGWWGKLRTRDWHFSIIRIRCMIFGLGVGAGATKKN